MSAPIEIIKNPRLEVVADVDGLHITVVGETFNSENYTTVITWDRMMEFEEFIFDDEEWE